MPARATRSEARVTDDDFNDLMIKIKDHRL